MEQKDYLLARMEDLADKAVKAGFAASRFLTPAEAQMIADGTKSKRAALFFDGGYEDAERTRAVFLNPDWGEYDRAQLFTALNIEYRQEDALGHRDIMGAVLALGIERETIGDIIIEDCRATLVCLPELGDYIAENLIKVGRAGVKVSEIGLDALPRKQENLIIKTENVSSLRLDAVLSAAFGLSRTKAAALIAADCVNLDHQLCARPAKELYEGALLSVRGFGRAKLLEVGGMSRKNRVFVQIGVYGR